MENKLQAALAQALQRWESMSRAEGEDAEETAEGFEAAFYRFIDALREWVHHLEARPETVEALFELPLMRDIVGRLPVPLLLNLETEAELILDGIQRMDEDKME